MAHLLRRYALFTFFLGMAAAMQSQPQPATADVRIGDSVVALQGPWKFSIGDSPIDPATNTPVWAEPGFDDSQWETVDLTPKAGATDPVAGNADYVPGWSAKGHPGYWGYAWYRIRVRVDNHPGSQLALAGSSDVDDSYQVFDNGSLIGSFGDFSSRTPSVLYTRPVMFVLPETHNAATGESTRTLAFRLWMEPYTLTQGDDVGGFHTAPLLGESAAIANRHQVLWDQLIRTYFFSPVQAVVFGVLGILVFSLALFDRTDRVYLWIGALLLMVAADAIESCFAVWSTVGSSLIDVWFNTVFLHSVEYGWWVMVWRVWFRQRRPAWVPWTLPPLLLLLMLSTAISRHLYFTTASDAVIDVFHFFSLAIRFLLALLMLSIAFRGIRDQRIEGWLVLPAVLLAGVSEFYGELSSMHILPFWFPFGVRIRTPELTDALLIVVLCVLLLRRLFLSIRRQRLMALDVKQAQEVQQVLIPESIPQIPGFAMQAVYKPAGEVGGDFFQILPVSSGGVLIVIGDVSGKGMPAAMTVALLVGTVRTLAHSTHSPREILTALNHRMIGRTRGGFTTCCVIFADTNGTVTAANAGHLSPYLNGKEIRCENSLPLGLSPEEDYSEATFHLPPGGQVTLITDGVVEARSKSGELFGFDRTAAISTHPAEIIAHTTQTFGQDDDITVITLNRLTIEEHSTQLSANPALAPTPA
jgi:Stage II sporulation protein E (SpoIIE)